MASKRSHADTNGGTPAKKVKLGEGQQSDVVARPLEGHLQTAQTISAKSWATAQLALSRRLETNSELYKECLSLLGSEAVGTAMKLGQELRLKSSQLDASPATPALTAGPNVSYKKLESDSPTTHVAPAIQDAELERITFIHKSTLASDVTSQGIYDQDYERLEFYGDAVLQWVSTHFLWTHYPKADVGQLSYLREMMVKNETLARFTILHKLDDRIVMAPMKKDQRQPTKRLGAGWAKILADVFEAYVGAVVLSRQPGAFRTVEKWLWPLWKEVLDQEKVVKYNKEAKHELSKNVMGKGIKLFYEETQPRQKKPHGREVFSLGVYLTGWGWERALLGQGRGNSKDEAGWQAATDALKNPITSQATRIKKDFDKLVKEEREREGGERAEVIQALEAEFK